MRKALLLAFGLFAIFLNIEAIQLAMWLLNNPADVSVLGGCMVLMFTGLIDFAIFPKFQSQLRRVYAQK